MGPFFLVLAGLMLLAALAAVWQSLRALLGSAAAADGSVAMGPSDDRATLLDEKGALLRSIKDLEFERAVGKVSDEDFQRLDRAYRERAKQVLRELDADVRPFKKEAEALVEARIAKDEKARAKRSKDKDKDKDKDEAKKETLEPASPPPEAAPAPARVTCPKCSTSNDGDAEFCKKCGVKLSEAEP